MHVRVGHVAAFAIGVGNNCTEEGAALEGRLGVGEDLRLPHFRVQVFMGDALWLLEYIRYC